MCRRRRRARAHAVARDGVREHRADLRCRPRRSGAASWPSSCAPARRGAACRRRSSPSRPAPDGCVAVRKTLFSYPRADSIGRRPKGSSFSTGSLQIKDFTKRYAGLELRTIESYARGNDPGCCPTYQRTSYWRFDTAKRPLPHVPHEARAPAARPRGARAAGASVELAELAPDLDGDVVDGQREGRLGLGRLDRDRLGVEVLDEPVGDRGAQALERLVGALRGDERRDLADAGVVDRCPRGGR